MAHKKKIWKGHKDIAKRDDMIVKDGKRTDVVIAVMGPTGVGKSTFINTYFNRKETTLKSSTVKVDHLTCPHPLNPAKRLVVVEMPGFDDKYAEDAEILRRICVWFGTSYANGMELAGVIYLYEISQKRMLETTRKNLNIFRKLCGDGFLSSVILGTTKWSQVTEREGNECLKMLQGNLWKPIIHFDFRNTQTSAQKMVDSLLRKQHKHRNALLLQKELVDEETTIPNTVAGKELQRILEQHLKRIKNDKSGRKQILRTSSAIQALTGSSPQRLSPLQSESTYRISKTTVSMERTVRSTTIGMPLNPEHRAGVVLEDGIRSREDIRGLANTTTSSEPGNEGATNQPGLIHVREVHEKLQLSSSTAQGGIFSNAHNFGVHGSALIDAATSVSQGSTATVNNTTYITNKHHYYIFADREALCTLLENDDEFRRAAEAHCANRQVSLQCGSTRTLEEISNEVRC